jgi:oligosaccharide translocation protein RFT1
MYYIYFLIHEKEDRHRLFLISSLNNLLLKPTSPFVDDRLVNEILEYSKQGISMRILRDGQKYIITMFNLISYEDQAIFHLIYLLGSIFPDLIFSTIQQISFNYFQQTLNYSNNEMLLKQREEYHQRPTPTGIYISFVRRN